MALPSCCDRCGNRHLPTAACVADAPLGIFTRPAGKGQSRADHLEDVAVAWYSFHRPLGVRPFDRPRPVQHRCGVAGAAPRSSDMLRGVAMWVAAGAVVGLLALVLEVLLLLIRWIS